MHKLKINHRYIFQVSFTLIFVPVLIIGDDLIGFRIFGGEDAEENEFPSHVYIRNHKYSATKKRMATVYCGGTIISDKWILTSGHCVNDSAKLFIGAGSSNRTKAKYHEALRSITHEKLKLYGRNDNKADNDLALVELEIPLVIDNTSTAVMLLPEHNDTISTYKGVIVVGWGRNTYGPVNPGQESPKILQKLLVHITSCPDGSTNVVCIVSPQGTGVCDGDSGGPLLIDGKIFGVASYVDNINPDPNLNPNEHCTDAGTWASYMFIPTYRQWIKEYSGV